MKNSSTLVSVCMLAYNHEKYIRQSIESILMQETNFEFDLIIANDNSSDDTDKIILDCIANNPKGSRISYINNKINLGARQNAKNALEACKGKYIALCEGDDYWTNPLKLKKQVDFLESNEEYSMCFHEVEVLQDNHIIGTYSNLTKDIFSIEDFFEKHIVATCSILYRNIIEIPDWSIRIASADKLLIFLFALKGKIKFLNETMGGYRLHSGGVSNFHFGINKVYDMSTLLNLFDEYSGYEYHEHCKKSLQHEIDVHILAPYRNELVAQYSIKNYSVKRLIKEIILKVISKVRF